MTVEEKRDFVKAYCHSHSCRCSVGNLAKARGEVRKNGTAMCWNAKDVTEEMLDARIEVILAEQGSTGLSVDDHTRLVEKRDECQMLCNNYDGCCDCPCNGLAVIAHDDYCNFDEFSEEELDEYLKIFEDAKIAKELAAHEVAPATPDNVNHPQHYELPNGLECIDVLLATQGKDFVMGFCICNAMKYLYRHKRKNGVEDIKKARWYIDKYLELEAQSHD